MKSKKLISLLCAAALTASSLASLTAFAAAGDKIGSDLLSLNFNSTTNFEGTPAITDDYAGVLANGTNTASVTATILTDGTAVKTVGEGQTAGLTLVTTNRQRNSGSGDRGWYEDNADPAVLVKNGSWFAIEEKTTGDNYLHMNFPCFGYYLDQGTYAHADFPATYTATAEKDYVVEFKAKFNNGIKEGAVSTENPYNPVLRIGTFDASTKTANAVEINKRALEIGDDWITVKVVTSLKGTKVYLNGSDVYSATAPTATSITGFGLYSEDGHTNVPVPLDIKGDSLDAAKHAVSPSVDIDDLVIYEAEPEKEVDVTINYVDANDTAIEGKASVTLTGIVGKQFTVPASYKVAFNKDDDQYYTYTSGGDTPITVVDGTNTINLKFTATDKPTVTFKGVCGTKELGTIGTAKGMPGEKVTSADYAHAYMQDADEKWYEKVDVLGGPRGNIATFNLEATVGSENSTVNVAYKPAYDVVEFIEVENDETASADSNSTYSTNYPKLYASGGQWRKSGDAGEYVTGFYTSAVEAAGTYEITVRSYGPDKRSGAIGVLDREGKENKYATKIAELNTDGLNTTTVTADLEEGNLFWVGKNSAEMSSSKSTAKKMDEIDYIVVKNTSLDAAPVPAVTIGDVDTTAATAALTLTNKEEFTALGITPKVTLIQAVYNGTTLSDVKIWNNIEINSTTGTATATITGAATGASVFYVWDTVGGVRPLGVAKTVTAVPVG